MSITFHPQHGQLLYCDFSGFKVPEMVKSRPVVVLSRKHKQLCTVVPLSGTEPVPQEACHHPMLPGSLPEYLDRKGQWWAKCDCVTTVAFSRLDRIKLGRDPNTGKRLYGSPKVAKSDLAAIKVSILGVLAMSDLIVPIE
jgi:uncharacterized protein YifN (PemK superfamily)